MCHAPGPLPDPPPSPPAPWISRDLYAAEVVTLGLRRYRLEVRAFRMDPGRPAEPCYCVFRLDGGRWTHLRPSIRAPERVARRGAALVAAAERIDLSTASYGPGATIDRTAAAVSVPVPT